MLKIIRAILQLWIDDIDSGNSNISEELLLEALALALKLLTKELSKVEAAEYIGVCRATFDNYVKNGMIPEGRKRQGFKEKSWLKSDLDKFLKNHQK